MPADAQKALFQLQSVRIKNAHLRLLLLLLLSARELQGAKPNSVWRNDVTGVGEMIQRESHDVPSPNVNNTIQRRKKEERQKDQSRLEERGELNGCCIVASLPQPAIYLQHTVMVATPKLYPRATVKRIVKAHSRRPLSKNADILVSRLLSSQRDNSDRCCCCLDVPGLHALHAGVSLCLSCSDLSISQPRSATVALTCVCDRV